MIEILYRRSMYHRIISTFLVVFLTVVCSPGLIQGQSIDSLLYLIDNDLVKDDSDKYDLLCQVITDINDAESKIRYCDQAIELAQKLDVLPALPYLKKGEGYLDSGKLARALDCFIQAANYYEKNDDGSNLGRVYLLMAETYNSVLGNLDNEKLYLQNAIEIFEQEKDSLRLSYALHNLGYTNYSSGQYDTALVVYTETLDLFKKLDHPYATHSYFICLGNSGLVYSKLLDFDKAEEYLLTAIDTLTRLGDEDAVAEFMIGYANILRQKGEIKQAITYASRALKITDVPNYERDASLLLARLYEISGRIDSAYYYQSIFIVANDSTKNIKSVQKMADLRTEYEVGRIQAEVDVLEKNKLRQKIINIGLGIILILAIGLVTLYYTNLKRSRKLSRALEERGVLLEKQSSELKEKNEELTVLNEAISKQKNEIVDSISYAKRIQSAMLPPDIYVTELLNESFIFYKPRDIVSGDFYWIKQINQYIILIAADCTGHGVPGALMSMLGISHLNEIVHRREITQANQILNELRKRIKFALRQHGQRDEAKDGIDMALCVLDSKNMTMQYSGANNPLYLIRDEDGVPELKEIKADRMPIGFYHGKDRTFTNHDIQLEIGDTFYLFTDGFMDQKGGKENKKLMSRKFKSLLLEIHDRPMFDQQDILDKTLSDWMGSNSQMDDILVVGVRV